MNLNDKIYIAGHKGMVGYYILRHLKTRGFTNLVFNSHENLDLTNQKQLKNFFKNEKPDYVVLAAAKLVEYMPIIPILLILFMKTFSYRPISLAHLTKNQVKRLLFLGSSCIYPKKAQQPITENSLLTGVLEPTNEPYAIAKIAGIKLCESYNRQYGTDYRSVMPSNLYGINDNFHPENSHVIPGLINRFHQAKINNDDEVIIWGTGKAKREFTC